MDTRPTTTPLDGALRAAILRRRARFAELLSQIAGISLEQAHRVFRPLLPKPTRALEPG